MTAQPRPEIVLYDLACTKSVCFSPVVWRIRLMLNYKRISYKTIFLDFPDIEPTLKALGLAPPEPAPGSKTKHTVPAIHHTLSNTTIMDSTPIAQFFDSTYPDPAVPLTSSLGREIESRARKVVGTITRNSIMPREVNVLSPRAADYFRRTREAALGHALEDLLVGEEESWRAAEDDVRAVGELMRTHQAEGPFVLSARPSYTDFFVAGALQSARVVDEGVWRRIVGFPGYGEVYEACLPWMERRD